MTCQSSLRSGKNGFSRFGFGHADFGLLLRGKRSGQLALQISRGLLCFGCAGLGTISGGFGFRLQRQRSGQLVIQRHACFTQLGKFRLCVLTGSQSRRQLLFERENHLGRSLAACLCFERFLQLGLKFSPHGIAGFGLGGQRVQFVFQRVTGKNHSRQSLIQVILNRICSGKLGERVLGVLTLLL